MKRFISKKNYCLNDLRNNRGGTVLLLTLLILSVVITISLNTSEILRKGVISGRNQNNATKAFFAAESGVERFLYEVWRNNIDIETVQPAGPECANTDCLEFDPSLLCDNTCTDSNVSLPNNSEYIIHVGAINGVTYATSTGSLGDINRTVVISY